MKEPISPVNLTPLSSGHVVIAYKVVDLGDNKQVFYYDPNYSLDTINKNFNYGRNSETFGVFSNKGFTYDTDEYNQMGYSFILYLRYR